MIFGDDDEKEINDYFDGEQPENQPEEPVEPKKPTYKPDDPAYWEEEEPEFEHLKPRSKWKIWLWVILALAVVGFTLGCWLRYFSPFVEDATQYGYVEHIERRGTLFKTYEGVLIPYRELMDTTRIYSRDFIFSVKDDTTAATLKRAQLEARPVRVNYKQYHASVPWRGASKILVVEADTVDPHKILPPEFAPIRNN